MLTRSKMEWKAIDEGTSMAHFSSHADFQQVYVKKINSLENGAHPVTMFLFHDLCAHHGRFNKLVQWLRTQFPEMSFILMDYIGHGLSSGTRGHVENFSNLVGDMGYIFHALEKKTNEEWIALGHGMGGLALLELVSRFDESESKIDKLILSNFMLSFNDSLLKLHTKLSESSSTVKNLIKSIRAIEVYPPREILSGTKEQTLYLDDPLVVRRPTLQTFNYLIQTAKGIYQSSYFLDKPTLFLSGQSPYIMNRGEESFSKGFKKGLLVQKKYSNLKHDLYNEGDNLNVFNDIAQWIQS